MDINLQTIINKRKADSYEDYSDKIYKFLKTLRTRNNTDERFIFKEYTIGENNYSTKFIQIPKDETYDSERSLNGVREVYLDIYEYWKKTQQQIMAIIMQYDISHNILYERLVDGFRKHVNEFYNIPFNYFCIINNYTIQFIFPIDTKYSTQNLVAIEKIKEGLDKFLTPKVKMSLNNSNLSYTDELLIPGAIYNGYQAIMIAETENINELDKLYKDLCGEMDNLDNKPKPEPLLPNNNPLKKRNAMGKVGQWKYYKERALNICADITFLVQYKNLSAGQQERLFDITTKMLLQIKHNADIYKKCPEDIVLEDDIKKLIIKIYKNIGIKLNENVEKISKEKLKEIYSKNSKLDYFVELTTGYKKPKYIYNSKKFLDILKPTNVESTYMIELVTDEELDRRKKLRVQKNNDKIKQRNKEKKEKKKEEFKQQYYKLKEQGLKQTEIAKKLGIQYSPFCRKLKRLGIR